MNNRKQLASCNNMQNKVNKDKSTEVLKAFGNPVIKTPTTNLVFARQSQEDVNQIEKMSDDELIDHYKSLVWMNYIYGQVCLNDLQRISLLELEIDNRPNINTKELDDWYNKTQQEFEVSQLEDLKNECELNSLESATYEG
jgi:hypothetical protein